MLLCLHLPKNKLDYWGCSFSCDRCHWCQWCYGWIWVSSGAMQCNRMWWRVTRWLLVQWHLLPKTICVINYNTVSLQVIDCEFLAFSFQCQVLDVQSYVRNHNQKQYNIWNHIEFHHLHAQFSCFPTSMQYLISSISSILDIHWYS